MDIILIGMPGCGKTTIGRMLAKRLKMELLDLDSEIEKAEGRKIPEIFEKDGEEYFRACETKCLKLSLGKGCVISTGGGIVVTEENHKIIKQSGAPVVFIDRPLECIMGDVDTKSRPLLANGKERLIRLHSERYDKYISLCNIRVVNDGTREEAVSKIIDEVNRYENYGNKRS